MIHLKILIITLFVFNLVGGEIQTIKKTINLQPKELLSLELDQFYSFTAATITWPTNLPSDQIIKPYEYSTTQYQNTSEIKTLASFEDGINQKYFLGFSLERNEENNTSNVIIIYSQLFIDEATGILQKKELSKFKSNLMSVYSIQASFYNKSQGFITSNNPGATQGLFYFTYTLQSGLIITNIKYGYISEHISIQGPSNSVYIIYFSTYQTFVLLKFNTQNQTVAILDTKSSTSKQFTHSIVNNQNLLYLYDYDQNILINPYINFPSETLLISSTNIPQFQGQYQASRLQVINETIIITLEERNLIYDCILLKLKQSDFYNGREIQLLEVKQSHFKTLYIPTFINEKYLICYYNSNIMMINFETLHISFEIQLNANQYVDTLQYIGNQFIIYQSDKDNAFLSSSSAKLQIPSIIISDQSQSYNLKIFSSQQEDGISIELTINTTTELISTINEDNMNILNYTPQVNEDIQYIPIEQYVTGSNLNPTLTAVDNIKNVKISKLVNVDSLQEYDTKSFKKLYQIDGQISSIIMSNSGRNNQFILTFSQINLQSKENTVKLFSSASTDQFTSEIAMIDNYGSFILKSDASNDQKIIYIPFINNNTLQFNMISGLSCNESFSFASDPSNNILFFLCKSKIQQIKYQYNNYNNLAIPNSFIVSQTTLDGFNDPAYDSLICIKGKLFISSKIRIIQFDYILGSFVGKPLTISNQQNNNEYQVILFSTTFLVVVIEKPIKAITQFSYGNFQTGQPIKLRNLYVGSQYEINPNLNLIPKRNEVELLFAETTTKDEYIIYRINDVYSQNQLYTTVAIQSNSENIPIISTEAICSLSAQVSCQKILKSASISYQFNIDQTAFNKQLLFASSIQLNIGQQKQNYNLQIVRNAATQFGTVNTQDNSLQQLRTQIQDSNFTFFQIFYFNDHSVYNDCILGWENLKSTYFNVINRMSVQLFYKQSQSWYLIMYNLKVQVMQGKFIFGNNLASYNNENISTECVILDDQSSKKTTDATVTIDVYAFCLRKMFTLNMSFTIDGQGSYTQALVNNSKSQSFDPLNYLSQIQKVITIDGNLQIYDLVSQSSFTIIQENQINFLSLNTLKISNYISYNVINSLNLQLKFYINGDLNVKNTQSGSFTTINISEQLQNFSFYVDQTDGIYSIVQIADTQFRIQYSNSFIYEVTFDLNNQNQLIITSARLFYYQDGFQVASGGIIGGRYTLLFGLNNQQVLKILLYDNTHINNGQLLIESLYSFPYYIKDTRITYIEEITENSFLVYFFNGSNSLIEISAQVGLEFMDTKSSLGGNQITIAPIQVTNPLSQISFYIQPTDDPTPSGSQKIIFSILILIINIIFQI